MRIAIASNENNGLDSQVSQHFGHAGFFVLVDVEDQEVKGVSAVENPFGGGHAPGQLPEFIGQQNVQVMLSGGMGQRAVEFFRQYGVQAVTGASGTVRQSLEGYLGGSLKDAAPCTDHAHHDGCEN